jgi:hypothetical protein
MTEAEQAHVEVLQKLLSRYRHRIAQLKLRVAYCDAHHLAGGTGPRPDSPWVEPSATSGPPTSFRMTG